MLNNDSCSNMETHMYMPLPKVDAPLFTKQADVVLMFELSGNLHGSWAKSWDGVIGLPHHRKLFNLLLWLLDRAQDIQIPVALETVVEQNTDKNQILR